MITSIVSFLAGSLFAVGLALAGMTQPAKVTGFLDFTAKWDPSLAFVMGGAIIPFALAYLWSRRAPASATGTAAPTRRPRFAHAFPLLPSTNIDRKLVLGAALFGVGWGLSGICPGPGIVSLGAASGAALYFVPAMIIGMAGYHVAVRKTRAAADLPPLPTPLAEAASEPPRAIVASPAVD